VAFAIATATICMVHCLCVAHAHVFVGCSHISARPVWDSPSPEWHTWLRNYFAPQLRWIFRCTALMCFFRVPAVPNATPVQ
jgi:hypothetical protein